MELSMIGHSSVMFRDARSGIGILCDPWLSGRVFNNGWAQSPESVLSPADLDRVTHLFISHEHPDHLHFPTLKSFPTAFKERVVILFQKLHEGKVPAALNKLGYRNIRCLAHLEECKLTEQLSIYIYQHRHLDSALLLKSDGHFYLNLNDAELSYEECVRLRKRFGDCDLLLTQFSIAGSDGIEDLLPAAGEDVLEKVLKQAEGLQAKTVIPFASFMYFCAPDNAHLNRYVNKVVDVKRLLSSRNLRCHLLFPGSSLPDVDHIDTPDDEDRFNAHEQMAERKIYPLEDTIPVAELIPVIEARIAKWKANFPGLLIRRMGTVVVRVTDLERSLKLNFAAGTVTKTDEPALIHVNSQPLKFAFEAPFGVQTLGVSGRYRLERRTPQWRTVRIVSSLHNAGISLTARGLFSSSFLTWAWSRRSNIVGNAAQQYRRFFGSSSRQHVAES